ncbi:hypothetical protein NDU88_005716 [Pleurodeles waltl]|uniref:Uncharacterized protein n=1 Tax=Pleurodeles waltl TaxID=8319 RepID=A0AAV7N065_PLEWA|nr:hypothetical protein NDU88_005716 [Pleurodeles waltl]
MHRGSLEQRIVGRRESRSSGPLRSRRWACETQIFSPERKSGGPLTPRALLTPTSTGVRRVGHPGRAPYESDFTVRPRHSNKVRTADGAHQRDSGEDLRLSAKIIGAQWTVSLSSAKRSGAYRYAWRQFLEEVISGPGGPQQRDSANTFCMNPSGGELRSVATEAQEEKGAGARVLVSLVMVRRRCDAELRRGSAGCAAP